MSFFKNDQAMLFFIPYDCVIKNFPGNKTSIVAKLRFNENTKGRFRLTASPPKISNDIGFSSKTENMLNFLMFRYSQDCLARSWATGAVVENHPLKIPTKKPTVKEAKRYSKMNPAAAVA